MKVILLKDVEKLGNLGDEIVVKDGFAANFLIPQQFAVEATKGNLQIIGQKKKEKARREKQIKDDAQVLAKKIASLACTISVEVGEGDKMFGAVTSEMIAESLKAEGIEVEKRKIELEEPIRALGTHNVEIKIHPEIKAQAKIRVVKK